MCVRTRCILPHIVLVCSTVQNAGEGSRGLLAVQPADEVRVCRSSVCDLRGTMTSEHQLELVTSSVEVIVKPQAWTGWVGGIDQPLVQDETVPVRQAESTHG